MLTIVKEDYWRDLKLTLYSNSIMRMKPTCEVEYELEDLLEYHDFLIKFVEGNPHLVLSDIRDHYFKVSKEVMATSGHHPEMTKLKIAEAVLVRSLPNRLLANFYMSKIKPNVVTRVFSNETKAIKWLIKQREIAIAKS